MPNLYARQTALTNVGGRIDYISNPDRQENLLAVQNTADAAYWQQLARECKLASKHKSPGTKSVQGRELVLQLSNNLLQRLSAEEIAKKIAESFKEKYNRDCVVALHFNKAKTNLHVHVIYSERERLQKPEEKVATRALFFDETGKRHYKKAEILDEDGEVRPGCQIVAKGEIYERRYFGPVDPVFSSQEWLRDCKTNWVLPLRNNELKGDVEIQEFVEEDGKLPQQHVGNKAYNSKLGKTREQIEEYNAAVREYNHYIDQGKIHPETAADMKDQIKKSRQKNELLLSFIDKIRAFFKIEKKKPEEKKKPSLDALVSGGMHRERQQDSTQTPSKQKEQTWE